ncbi:copper chaperone PCu(A)C [Microbispora hainanensis]|uniref:Copper chaperone PCu(A)C n=1 Tax=Microbispora hainanensis TaxID=568844 RepID=A0A544Z1R4_9ACTN|nr:copper chaperone PCu(A)C [Microbispora hainanensis]TQS22987.1 copper chaperone PCu(A)C [Microbispora hainanensis]
MRAILAALCVAAAAVTAACGDMKQDFYTQTIPQNDGANADLPGMLIRNAFIIGPLQPAPPGTDMPMYMVLLNQSGRTDRLVSVDTGGVFREARLPTPGGLEIPAGKYVGGTPFPQVLLAGLTRPLRSGGTIPVTFRFQNAGTVRVQVPVLPPGTWRSTYSPWPGMSPFASPSPSPALSPGSSPAVSPSPSPAGS